jgi:hypothetical protein
MLLLASCECWKMEGDMKTCLHMLAMESLGYAVLQCTSGNGVL